MRHCENCVVEVTEFDDASIVIVGNARTARIASLEYVRDPRPNWLHLKLLAGDVARLSNWAMKSTLPGATFGGNVYSLE